MNKAGDRDIAGGNEARELAWPQPGAWNHVRLIDCPRTVELDIYGSMFTF